jgi:hypothetical protein
MEWVQPQSLSPLFFLACREHNKKSETLHTYQGIRKQDRALTLNLPESILRLRTVLADAQC